MTETIEATSPDAPKLETQNGVPAKEIPIESSPEESRGGSAELDSDEIDDEDESEEPVDSSQPIEDDDDDDDEEFDESGLHHQQNHDEDESDDSTPSHEICQSSEESLESDEVSLEQESLEESSVEQESSESAESLESGESVEESSECLESSEGLESSDSDMARFEADEDVFSSNSSYSESGEQEYNSDGGRPSSDDDDDDDSMGGGAPMSFPMSGMAKFQHLVCTKDYSGIADFLKSLPKSILFKDALDRTGFHVALLMCNKEMVDFLIKTCIALDEEAEKAWQDSAAAASTAADSAPQMNGDSSEAPPASAPEPPPKPRKLLEAMLSTKYERLPNVNLASIGLHFDETRAADAECMIRAIMEHRTEVNEEDGCGWTALHLAAKAGSLSVCKFLLEKGFDVNHADNWGWWPLHYAIESGNIEVMKYLIPLSLAALEKVKELEALERAKELEKAKELGLDKDDEEKEEKNTSGFKSFNLHPLFVCIERGSWKFAALLMQMGFELPEVFLQAALAAAQERGYDDTLTNLLEAFGNRDESGFDFDTFELTDQSSETAILTHKDVFRHIEIPDEVDDPMLRNRTISSVVENASRLEVLCGPLGILRSEEFSGTNFIDAPDPLSWTDALRVHEQDYLLKLKRTCESLEGGSVYKKRGLDAGDTNVTAGSWNAAMAAAGCVTAAVDLIANPEAGVRNAFCAVRPPGHHLGPAGAVDEDLDESESASQGFCLVNNIAIGAAYARHVHRHLFRRVAVIDIDVHHGNGTEAIVRNLGFHQRTVNHRMQSCGFAQEVNFSFHVDAGKPWLDPQDDEDNVFFASIHGFWRGFYPGTGESGAYSKPEIHNVAMSEGSKSTAFRQRMRREVLQPLMKFAPDIIFISAGFDGHENDLIGSCKYDERDFDWVTQQLMGVANACCEGRVVSVLEGGYNQRAGYLSPLALCVGRHVKSLMTTSSQYQAPETRAAYTEDSIEAAEKEDREIRDLRLMLRPEPEVPIDQEMLMKIAMRMTNKRGRDEDDGEFEAKRAKMFEVMRQSMSQSAGDGGGFDLNALMANAIGVPQAGELVAAAEDSGDVVPEFNEEELFGEVEDETEGQTTNLLATSQEPTETAQETSVTVTESMDVDE